MDARNLIQKLQLQPHPEGGFYKETYRSEEKMMTSEGLVRNVSTAIYFLLENDDISHFHRIKSDEAWFFHQGEPIEIVILHDGKLQTIDLGNDLKQDEIPQTFVPKNVWFASKIKHGIGYSLVSCTVAPGFDFSDFEMANRNELLKEYPEYKSVIEEYTR